MRFSLFSLPESSSALTAALPDIFAKWDNYLTEAEPIFELDGKRIDEVCKYIPHHQAKYATYAQEAKAVVRWLEIAKQTAEAKYMRNYNQSPRALSLKEQTTYIGGEREVVELNQLLAEATMKKDQFEQVVEAIKQAGWMLNGIIRLRAAQVDDSL